MKKSIYIVMIPIVLILLISCKEKSNLTGTKIIFTENAPKPIGPYSQAVQVGSTLYLSGQIAIDPASGKLDTADITVQTQRVMQNLQAVLKASDMDFSNVVKTSIFLTNMKNFPTVNDIYGKFFTSNPPARETIQVAALPKKVGIEISMIAHK